jgi:hypothetical protein
MHPVQPGAAKVMQSMGLPAKAWQLQHVGCVTQVTAPLQQKQLLEQPGVTAHSWAPIGPVPTQLPNAAAKLESLAVQAKQLIWGPPAVVEEFPLEPVVEEVMPAVVVLGTPLVLA